MVFRVHAVVMAGTANRLSLVCFDLGGVLVKICRSLREACERSSIPSRNSSWLDGRDGNAARKTVMDAYQLGDSTTPDYYEALSRALGPDYHPKEAQAIHEAWTIGEYPGVHSLLGSLAESSSFATACLSNTNERHWQMLFGQQSARTYPSLSLLDTRLASHELRKAKPDPQIYQVAAARFCDALGSPPRSILFFDDLQENVAAARAAGWTAHCIDPLGDPVCQIREVLGPLD